MAPSIQRTMPAESVRIGCRDVLKGGVRICLIRTNWPIGACVPSAATVLVIVRRVYSIVTEGYA